MGRLRSLLWFLLVAAPVSAAYQGAPTAAPIAPRPSSERPPRIPSSPRYFGRVVRPVQPRTSATLSIGHVQGGRRDGVEPEQWSVSVTAEAAYRWVGAFLELPLVADSVSTEGVYGEGSASVTGAGDLRFGLDARLRSWRGLAALWTVGVGAQATAPTGSARVVTPAAPHVPAPDHRFGPAEWTTSGGAGLAVALPRIGLDLQLNADLLAHLWDDDRTGALVGQLFGALALVGSYRLFPWLIPMLQIDLQLELYGEQKLRQLVLLCPALRFRPLPRIAIDLGARLPVRRETRDEHRLSVGLSISVGLGPEGDDAW